MRLLFTLIWSPAKPWPWAPWTGRLTEAYLALFPTRPDVGIHSAETCRDQRLIESLHCPVCSTIKGKERFRSGASPPYLRWRGKEMDGGDRKSTANAQRQLLARLHVGDTRTASGSASNGKRHLPHPTLKHCCSVPLSKDLSLCHLMPVGPLECSAEFAPWSAGSWSLLE